MGPQPNSCGNEVEVAVELTGSPLLQWGHSQTAVETGVLVQKDRTPGRFNGATAKQLWKQQYAEHELLGRSASMGPQPNSCGNQEASTTRVRARCLLQWGHSQTAVETGRARTGAVR